MNETSEILSWDLLALGVIALIIGIIGSLTYFGAIYWGFIADDDTRDNILKHFHKKGKAGKIAMWRVILYALSGGLIAAIFQLPQGTSVPRE